MFMIGLSVNAQHLEKVTDYKGQQVTGISVNEDGRIFVNFPRWRESVKYSVMKISQIPNGTAGSRAVQSVIPFSLPYSP